MTFATLGTTIAPASSTEILFGRDKNFGQDELNFGETWPDCGSFAVICAANPQPFGEVVADASVHDGEIDQREGESLMGVVYRLKKACDQQNLTLGFTATYYFNYTLTTTSSPLTGESLARINLRPDGTTAQPTANISAQNTEDKEATTSLAFGLAAELDRDYYTTLSTHAFARVSGDLPDPAVDSARGRAYASVSGISLDFHDDTPPTSTTTVTSGVAPVALGAVNWYKMPPTLNFHASDPILNAQQDLIPHSCVRGIGITNGTSFVTEVPVDFYQSDTSYTIWNDSRYDLKIEAVDNNGNKQSPFSLSVGYDGVGPVTTTAPEPATPTGNNTWYKRLDQWTAVKFAITCNDSNNLPSGQFSGCTKTNWTLSNGQSASWTTTGTIRVNAPEGRQVTVTANGLDRVSNGGAPLTSLPLKIDLTAPPVKRNWSAAPPITGQEWWNGAAWNNFECDGVVETNSGCAHNRTKLNGATEWTTQTNYSFSTESRNQIRVEVEDVAGNVRAATYNVNLDFTAPPPITNLGVAGAITRAGDTNVYYSGIPTWSWTASVDGMSGINHYNVQVDNGAVSTVLNGTSAYTPSSILDGQRCLKVTPVDKAGNVGPMRQYCVFVDRVKPTNTYVSPPRGKLILWNGETRDLVAHGQVEDTVILGPTWIELNASDAGGSNASGLWSTQIYDAFVPPGSSRVTLECDPATASASYCAFYEEVDDGFGQAAFSERWLEGDSYDNANNLNRTWRNYTRVDSGIYAFLPVVGGTQSSTPQGEVFWKPYQGTDFDRYEVHRSTTAGFTPSDGSLSPSTIVATITSASSATFTDAGMTMGQPYYYKVLVYHGPDGRLLSSTHESVITYALNDGGYVSVTDEECSVTAFTCLSA